MTRFGKVLATILGIAAAILVFAGAGRLSVRADGEHVHCYCGDGTCADGGHTHANDVTWSAWSTDNALPGSGNYYLTTDVTVTTSKALPQNTELNICLNGHKITGSNGFLFNMADGAASTTNNSVLRITDCSAGTDGKAEGSVVTSGTSGTRLFRIDASGWVEVYRITLDASNATTTYGSIAYLSSEENNRFKAFGVTMNAGKATKKGGAFHADTGTSTNYSQIELYHSTLSGGRVETGSTDTAIEGGNICLMAYTRVIISDSTVRDGSAVYTGSTAKLYCKGGNISSPSQARITISGNSVISGGTVSGPNWSAGGNLSVQGYLTITGNVTIENGSGQSDGGNLYMTGSQAKNITGATFSGGTASAGGSITFDSSTKAVLTNCTIQNGEAKTYGGNIQVKGDGTSKCNITLTNTKVDGGFVNPASSNTNSLYGGNISIRGSAEHAVLINGTSEIINGKVKNGTSGSSYGGNIGILKGTVTIKGSTKVQNGWIQSSNGFNICAYGGAVVIDENACIPETKVKYNGTTTKGNSISTNASGSTITVDGGTIAYVQCVAKDSTVTVTGGYVGGVSNHNGAVVIEGGTLLTVTGTGNTDTTGTQTNSMSISGGYIKDLKRDAKNGTYYGTLTISGGSFTTIPAAAAYTLEDGYHFARYEKTVTYTDTANATGSFTTTKTAVQTDHHHAVSVNAEVHPDGTTEDVYFIPWTETDKLPDFPGDYYLATDVAVSAQYNPAGNVNLCLNGHTISHSDATKRPVMMQKTSTLSVCDCGTTGTIRGSTVGAGTAGTVGVSGQTAGAIPVFNLYSGTLTGGALNATGSEDGGGIFGINKGGIVNIYGGTVSAGSTQGQGGIAIIRTGTPTGGSPTPGELHVYGGTISGGTADGKGQAIAAVGGILEIAGGEITGSTGDTIWIGENAAGVSITGGKIGSGSIVSDALTGFISGDACFTVKPDDTYAAPSYGFFAGSGVTGYDYKAERMWLVEATSVLADGSAVDVGGAVAGGGLYRAGASITLTAYDPSQEATPAYEFLRWEDESGTELGTSTELTLTVGAADAVYFAVYQRASSAAVVTITVNADQYTYKIGTGEAVEGTATFTANVGDEVTLTYTNALKTINGWLNCSGKLVSREATYTFIANSSTTYTAEAGGYGSAVVIFYGANYQVIRSMAVVDLVNLPDVPVVIGKTNGRWMFNNERVTSVDVLRAAGETMTTVEVKAAYDAAADTYGVTVSGRIEGSSGLPSAWTELAEASFTAERKTLGTVTEITAKTVSGKAFLYFADENGEILSRSASTNIRYMEDTLIYAVYGNESAAAAAPTVKIIVARNDGSSVYFEALRSIPEGYTLIEQGLLFTTDDYLGGLTPEEGLTPTSTACFKYVSNGKALNDVTGLLIKNVNVKVYAKGYIVVSDGQNMITVLSPEAGEATGREDLVPVQNVFSSLTAAKAKKFFYYFYQLSEEEQKAYNDIVTGLLAVSDEITLAGQVTPARIQEVSQAIRLDQPALFWYDGGFAYSYAGDYVTKIYPTYLTYDDLAAERAAFESIKDLVVSQISAMTEDQKVRNIHDSVISNVSYAFTTNYDQTAHYAMVKGTAVCAGYARATQYLLMAAGIPCYYCEGIADNGSGTEDHGWNIVQLNGYYYNMDVTWDEENSSDPDSRRALYDYFLLTDAEIEVDHVRVEYGTRLPACTTEYPFEEALGYPREVYPIVAETGVTTFIRSLDEYKAFRKAQLVSQCPGTATYSFVTTIAVYNEILDYNSDSNLYSQEFNEAAAELNMGAAGYGFSFDAPVNTTGAVLVTAQDTLVQP